MGTVLRSEALTCSLLCHSPSALNMAQIRPNAVVSPHALQNPVGPAYSLSPPSVTVTCVEELTKQPRAPLVASTFEELQSSSSAELCSVCSI